MASKRRDAWFMFLAAIVVLQVIVWRSTSRLNVTGSDPDSLFVTNHHEKMQRKISARNEPQMGTTAYLDRGTSFTNKSINGAGLLNLFVDPAPSQGSKQCHKLDALPLDPDLCTYVKENCPPSGHIDYLRLYYCSQSGVRPLSMVGLVLWMLFLFSWVGIVASDFFCPNLSTIASMLGLSESTAGVTFLAFGNGSPDVFSTFVAMKSSSGSLAIGELLGAASFIISVVAGSMMLIQPFRVNRYPFLRDVGFFTVAVALSLAFLIDGKLYLGETVLLIGLYVTYVAVVILGGWWRERQDKRAKLMNLVRDEYRNDLIGERYRDGSLDDEPPELERLLTTDDTLQRSTNSVLAAHMTEYYPETEFPFERDDQSFSSRAVSPQASQILRPRSNTLGSNLVRPPLMSITGRHSLLGAIEFRDVVNALHNESSARSLARFHMRPRTPGGSMSHHRSRSHHVHRTLKKAKSHSDGFPGLSHSQPSSPVGDLPSHFNVVRTSKHTPSASESLPILRGKPTAEEPLEVLVDVSPAVDDPWAGATPPATRTHPRLVIPESSYSRANESDISIMSAPAEVTASAVPWQAKKAPAQSDFSPLKKNLPSIQVISAAQGSPTHPGYRQDGSEYDLGAPCPPPKKPMTHRLRRVAKAVLRQLFPALQNLKSKSILGITAALLTAPSIVLLNLTLPVVEDDSGDCCTDEIEKTDEECEECETPLEGIEASQSDENLRRSTLVDLSVAEARSNTNRDREIAHGLYYLPDGVAVGSQNRDSLLVPSGSSDNHSTTLVSADTTHESLDNLSVCCSDDMLHEWNPHWTATQCFFAPILCAFAIFYKSVSFRWFFLGGLVIGLTLMALVILLALKRPYSPRAATLGRMARCLLGFFVSMVWIMAIVDEVVGILQTFGLILGVSDAILGLTIFAMGNSLGDFVANITIARLGYPIMAISACFAGPMLNLLLGVGGSGTWILASGGFDDATRSKGGTLHYPIDFNLTLLVSGLGLLLLLIATLVFVPLNNYQLSRRWGACLLGSYCVIMTANIIAEVFGS